MVAKQCENIQFVLIVFDVGNQIHWQRSKIASNNFKATLNSLKFFSGLRTNLTGTLT